MTPRELIRKTASRFQAAGIPDPESDAALLLSHLTGRRPLDLRMDVDTELTSAVTAEYEDLVIQRLKRIPLQYLLGEAPFFRRIFLVDSRVLIPRPETELLCEWALELLTDLSAPSVLDLCTGSGCIGLTVKAERPDALVTLSDISRDALDVASANADRLSLVVALELKDLLDGFAASSFDLIVSNPPYIPAADCACLQPEVHHEPLLALLGGPDGCDLYRRIIRTAGPVLKSGGMLLMELGIHESGILVPLLQSEGFTDIQIRQDYAGIDRMILAVHP